MIKNLVYSNKPHEKLIFNPASDAEIDRFRSEFNISIPDDYIYFLKKYNGGRFIESDLNDTSIGDLTVSRFYTLSKNENYSITESIENLEGYIPNKFIPIADDPGGNLYLLALDDIHYGSVFFWNHEVPSFGENGNFEDFENLTRLFNSFKDFIDSIK